MPESDLTLAAKGFTMDEIWEAFIEQVALLGERAEDVEGLSIDERLARQEQIVKLEKQIQKTEAAAWKEQQPKKRFALYQKLQRLQNELEHLKIGELCYQK